MQHMKNKNGFTIIELIMVMIIIGVLAAVAIPRFQDIVIESEVAVEQRIIQTIYDGLETYARERYVANGVRSWPDNPFVALSKLPPDYDADNFVLTNMKDRSLKNWQQLDPLHTFQLQIRERLKQHFQRLLRLN